MNEKWPEKIDGGLVTSIEKEIEGTPLIAAWPEDERFLKRCPSDSRIMRELHLELELISRTKFFSEIVAEAFAEEELKHQSYRYLLINDRDVVKRASHDRRVERTHLVEERRACHSASRINADQLDLGKPRQRRRRD